MSRVTPPSRAHDRPQLFMFFSMTAPGQGREPLGGALERKLMTFPLRFQKRKGKNPLFLVSAQHQQKTSYTYGCTHAYVQDPPRLVRERIYIAVKGLHTLLGSCLLNSHSLFFLDNRIPLLFGVTTYIRPEDSLPASFGGARLQPMRCEHKSVAIQVGRLKEAKSIEKCAPFDPPSFLLPLMKVVFHQVLQEPPQHLS